MAYCIIFGAFMHFDPGIDFFAADHLRRYCAKCLQLVLRIVMFVLDLITSPPNLCSLRTEQTQELYSQQCAGGKSHIISAPE